MEFKQDEQDFINELLGHAGLGDLNGDMGISSASDRFTNNIGIENRTGYFEDTDLGQDPARLGFLGHSVDNTIRQNNVDSTGPGFLIDESLGAQQVQPEFLSENALFQHEPFQQDPQDSANDDQLSSFTEDPVSSLGSSVTTSEFLSPMSSSFNNHPQRDSVDPASYSQFLSSSLRSPSNSLRQGNYLSSSLRAQGLNPRHSSVGSTAYQQQQLSFDPTGSGPQLSQEERLRRRREFHNAVERRRRELIKQKIKELSKIVPPSLLNYNDHGKEIKANKSVILSRSVDYLAYLQQVLEIQDRKRQLLIQKVRELEAYRHRQKTSSTMNANFQEPMTVGGVSSASPEQIIDARGLPVVGENSSSTPSTTIQDDLQQFLSGDLIDAEDNAKLMFGGEGNGTAADFLLKFGK
ncbi:LANO_0F12552g1_1 [Lachancea nothofagi CBS 11611]|uniref:LANO_0F12552g1_1 n=1 Tax=Lachancea nothofagi CBS 11611 TaxID=1266666 RepID=A0A1G4KBF0_9SACH|nr:LANO_0F12552g1_1 [Lachancea nothofagi CBS 11611]